MDKREILSYEVASLWMTVLLPTKWTARWVAWRVNRKWRRYLYYIESGKIFTSGLSKPEKVILLHKLRDRLSKTCPIVASERG